ncbi:MAG: methylenetetrahydrofolate--tRNA-(uracil(54)-C(5))-methyltransferase (FADH(2)-oxidizing) TrmFO [Candidatus Eremiobacteraeota bacterium]|nr:methylenetetrahydrofolate--tRNA-(uracil(54)-C(5))-methyltransferase (FADH(2)-oxidizing) TrmFO [Candidatus Eremiobacteraeota bacterium]
MIAVVGGGLAGCEAAWQAAQFGVAVTLYEMRPGRSGPAHKTGRLAELVCSNSLRGAALENAVGLLKEELAQLDSLVIACARLAAVPAGGALAVDRDVFADAVESRIAAHPLIDVRREEIALIPDRRPVIVACGPLPPDGLLEQIDALVGRRLHYFDAASPIVAADSIDESAMYRKSRYDKGDGADYLNIPLDRDQYATLLDDLRTLPRHEAKDFETDEAGQTPYFEGCLPIEEMADRGDETLRFGPLKPVGLRDPITDTTPHAVVQLRKENAEGTAYNLVGFQTRLTWPSQKVAFGRFPGFANAEWLRLGVMHRNTFIDSPRLLDTRLQLREHRGVFFAGQITGAEGYVEAAACGAMAGIHAARQVLGLPPVDVPVDTALHAVVAHLQNTQTPDFQPANVTWAYFTPDKRRGEGKRDRRTRLAQAALERIEGFKALSRPPLPAFSASSS